MTKRKSLEDHVSTRTRKGGVLLHYECVGAYVNHEPSDLAKLPQDECCDVCLEVLWRCSQGWRGRGWDYHLEETARTGRSAAWKGRAA